MNLPTTSTAGLLGFAIASKLLDTLITKGLLTEAEAAALIAGAADDFKQDARAIARPCEAYLRLAKRWTK